MTGAKNRLKMMYAVRLFGIRGVDLWGHWSELHAGYPKTKQDMICVRIARVNYKDLQPGRRRIMKANYKAEKVLGQLVEITQGGRIGAGSASVGCAENFWSCRMAEQQKIATDFVNGEVRRPEDDVLLSLRWRLKEHVVDFALSRLKELQMAEKEDADNDKT